jgi:hypothetical protein
VLVPDDLQNRGCDASSSELVREVRSRIARNEMDQQEYSHCDAEEDGGGMHEAAQHVRTEKRASPGAGPRTSRRPPHDRPQRRGDGIVSGGRLLLAIHQSSGPGYQRNSPRPLPSFTF